MNESPLISIIILNYNAGELLINCIQSITDSNYSNYEIILVDNNSSDQSHIHCKKKFEQIKLIENKKNYGYCEGNNIGIRQASGKFITILNPDTIVDKNWLEYWKIRNENPLNDAESLKINSEGYLTSIGQKVKNIWTKILKNIPNFHNYIF